MKNQKLEAVPDKAETFEPFLRIEEAAQFLGLSKNFLYENSRPDSPRPIPAHRANRYLLFKKSELSRWVSENGQPA